MIQNSGCLPIKPDRRDHPFTTVAFGAPQLPIFPKTLGRIKRKVKDQGASLSCTAQAVSLASEYQENLELSAAWNWMQTCKKLGTYTPNGADPRVAMSIAKELGGLPAEVAPFSFPETDSQTIGNWTVWPYFPESATEIYRKAAYIKIPYVHDHFDSVKTALLNGKKDNQIVMAFSKWHAEWTYARIVPTVYVNFTGYHAYTFIDFDTLDGVDYLVAQNSYGETMGDRGFHYFPRETVNKEFAEYGCGLYVFFDLTPEQIVLAKQESTFGRIQRMILDIWSRLTDIYR